MPDYQPVTGADLEAGMTIKERGQLYTITDIESDPMISAVRAGGRVASVANSAGDPVGPRIFYTDSAYQVRVEESRIEGG